MSPELFSDAERSLMQCAELLKGVLTNNRYFTDQELAYAFAQMDHFAARRYGSLYEKQKIKIAEERQRVEQGLCERCGGAMEVKMDNPLCPTCLAAECSESLVRRVVVRASMFRSGYSGN